MNTLTSATLSGVRVFLTILALATGLALITLLKLGELIIRPAAGR